MVNQLVEHKPRQKNLNMKTLLSFLFTLLLCSTLQADIGSTIIYKAKFVLKNGSSFVGYLPISGYDENLDANGRNEYCSDKAFQMMLINQFSKNVEQQTFQVYDHIYLVHCGQKDQQFFIGCVDKARIKVLRVRDIKYTVFLDAAYAAYDPAQVALLNAKHIFIFYGYIGPC